jgi:hypothetical protein
MTIPQFAPQDVLCGLVLATILLALSIPDSRRGILPNALTSGVLASWASGQFF